VKKIKMCIKYSDYKKSGYFIIPDKTAFARYSDMAERKIKRFVRNFKGADDENKRCIYEIADILYAGHNQLNRSLSGFANEGYREQYFKESGGLNTEEKIWETLRLYFTHEELYRGA